MWKVIRHDFAERCFLSLEGIAQLSVVSFADIVGGLLLDPLWLNFGEHVQSAAEGTDQQTGSKISERFRAGGMNGVRLVWRSRPRFFQSGNGFEFWLVGAIVVFVRHRLSRAFWKRTAR